MSWPRVGNLDARRRLASASRQIELSTPGRQALGDARSALTRSGSRRSTGRWGSARLCRSSRARTQSGFWGTDGPGSNQPASGRSAIGRGSSSSFQPMRAPISSSSSAATPTSTPGHPVLEVVFTAHNERLGARLFRHGVKNRVVPIPLTGAVVDANGRVVVDIEIDHPVSPKELGTGSDTRLLGLHLKWLMVRRTGVRGRWDTGQHRLRRADPRRLAGKATSTTEKSTSTLSSGR